MTKVIITEDFLSDIANSIRSKNGLTTTYTPAQMADAIMAIDGGGGGGGLVTITDEANATGITCVITTSSEPTPVETWETIYEVYNKEPISDTPYNYLWLNEQSIGDIYPISGTEWKITLDTNVYRCTAATSTLGNGNTYVTIGNPKYSQSTDNGSTAPFNLYNAGWGAWVGDTELPIVGLYIKIERLVTE